jgi:putative ABC transport system permease protein
MAAKANHLSIRAFRRLIALIGVIVPQRFRARWRREWEAEVQHRERQLIRWNRVDWQTTLELGRRTSGAIWDALWLQPRRLEEDMIQDLRFGLRMLWKQPGITLICVITLALGIGANTAIFSVVNAVLLQPLAFPEPERVLWIGGWKGNDKQQGVTPADFLDYREQSRSFTQLAASISDGLPMNLSGDGEPERLRGASVTTNYLDVFGVKPILGRGFVADEEPTSVVLSYALWTRRFGSDPSIINRKLTIDGRNCTVIGVMPSGFQYPAKAEIWNTFSFPSNLNSPFRSREFHFMRPIARLKSDVTLDQAQAEVATIARRLESLYPKTNTNQSLFLTPLQNRLVGDFRTSLLTLLGAVICVLLIASANVANLQLARSAARQKEIALRSALGASRLRVVRQLLTESLMLALLGGVGGVLLARWGVQLLVALSGDSLPRAGEVQISAPALWFTLAVSLLTGLFFGLAPSLQLSRLELTEALKEAGRGAGGVVRHRTLSLLVVTETALAVVLLVSAGLLLNSFLRMQRVGLGFDSTNLLTARIEIPNPYAQAEKKIAFFEQLQERIRALPGVEAVGMVTELPLANQSSDFNFKIVGRPEPAPGKSPHADIRNVNHDYFRAMRIPLLRGRSFTENDVRTNAKVVLISDILAKHHFQNEDPIGQRIYHEQLGNSPYEIIGVVGDIRHRGLAGDVFDALYFPTLRLGWTNVVIRTSADPATLGAAVRRQVAAIDPTQPVAVVKTMDQWITESVAAPRFRTALLGVFSSLALLLAIIGIYGVMSYAVTERTHELGVRMALGARARDVMRMVIHQGMTLAAVGVVVGVGTAFILTRWIKDLLFQVGATDPMTFAGVAALILGVAFVACLLPARRATKVDPMIALRRE